MKTKRRTLGALAASVAGVTGLIGFGATSAGAAQLIMSSAQKVSLTWWTWMADTPNVIKNFEKAYPGITVQPVPDYGAGTPFYTKLTTALAAGTGPCMTQVELDHLPQFANDMVSISAYDAKYRSDFPSWVWDEVDQNGKLLAMPGDIGPMGMMYQPSVFNQYHLPIPTTWSIFASDAVTLHKDNPKMYLTYFPTDDGDYLESLLWQAGAFPYHESNGTWTVNLNGPIEQKVIGYWANLIKEGAVPAVSDFTTEWEHQVASDDYAAYLSAAWAPTYVLDPYMNPKHPQTFALTAMPQWKAGANADANWGGSTYGVTKDCPSADVKDAALFVAYINTAPSALKILEAPVAPGAAGGAGVFPADVNRASVAEFNKPVPNFIGNINKEFANLSAGVPTQFQWSPWDTEITSFVTSQFGAAAAGKQSLSHALAQVQSQVVSYATSAGYSVRS